MDQYKDILLEVRDGVARITINRPEKYNAFTPNTCEELIDAFKKAGWDKERRRRRADRRGRPRVLHRRRPEHA